MNNQGLISDDDKNLQFEAMVNAYAKDLYRYGLWLTKDTQISEDLVQETFLRAWKAMGQLKDPKAVKSWLFTIYRRENARRFEKVRPDTTPIDDINIDQFAYIDDSFAKTEVIALRKSLKDLPAEYLEPLLLQVLGGYSCDEIGEVLNIKSGAVMTRLFRARKKLRALLEDDGSEFELDTQDNIAEI
ncbi:MAG: sigma-70 family RNA polymerase sigma factor [Gammaproteobacteria bacterium]